MIWIGKQARLWTIAVTMLVLAGCATRPVGVKPDPGAHALSHPTQAVCERFARAEAAAAVDYGLVAKGVGEGLVTGLHPALLIPTAGVSLVAGVFAFAPMGAIEGGIATGKARRAAYDDALSACREPMLAEESLGSAHPDVGRSLALFADRLVRYSDAHAARARRVAELRSSQPSILPRGFAEDCGIYHGCAPHEPTARTVTTSPPPAPSPLADRYLAEAEGVYARAIAIEEQALGPDHPDLASPLERYADVLRRLGRDDAATQAEARARGVRL